MSTRDKPPLEGPLDRYMVPGFDAVQEERIWAKVRARRALASSELPSGLMLPTPLGPAVLEAGGPTKPRARLWREVRARVHRHEKRRALRLGLAAASLLGAAAVCAFMFLTLRSGEPAAERGAPRALLVADGRALEVLETKERPLTVRMGDASEIRLAAGSRLEPLSSSASRFELLLARGSAEFSVTPGGPRRWLVEAGAARVEVVGTVFRVSRAGASVRVSVSRGAVLVRGENVPGWMRRLNAGEHLTVTGKERAERAPAVDAPRVPDGEPENAPSRMASPAAHRPPSPAPVKSSLRAHERHKPSSPAPIDERELSPAERYAALGPEGVAGATRNAKSIEELLELADIARLSGHPRDAVAPLERALDAFRSSRQAALAAFTLGRVQLDHLNAAEQAAEAFERALVLGLPRGLRADCYRRLAEAYQRASNQLESMRAEQRMREEVEAHADGPESSR